MLRVLTWNLNGLDDHRLDERAEAAALHLLLTAAPPEVVLLQEVVDRTLVAHLRPHFSNAGYAMAVQPASGEYYCAAMVRAPLKLTEATFHAFEDTDQGRGLLELCATDRGVSWRFGTAHLESGPGVESLRRAQLSYCLTRARDHAGPAVFAGDTNLRQQEARDLPPTLEIRDAWEALGEPRDGRGTWTPPADGKARWFRFDRAYVNARVELLALSTRMVQTDLDPVDASDHRALEIRVEARP